MPPVSAWTNRLGNRSDNQDRCLVLERPGETLLVVADGMGGHARGDLAAQTAIDSLRRSFLSSQAPIGQPRAFLQQALHHAHLDIIDTGNAQRPPLSPRTTCVVCLVGDAHAWWAHLGDSRLYLIRDGRIRRRTRDHTPVEEMVHNGLLDEAQIARHPLRNSVSRCLGGEMEWPKASFDDAPLRAGDSLLLCSDGLWSALDESRLCDLPRDPATFAARLNQLADEADVASYPHSDNISLVGLRWLARADEPAGAPGERAKSGDAAPATADPVQRAIADIHRALLDYAGEMKK